MALVVLGAMNLATMVIVAAVIAMEKLAPRPDMVVLLSGAAALIIGLTMMLRPMFLR